MDFSAEEDFIKIIKKHASKMEPAETGIKPLLSPLKNIKAVLFDIYGTLFISEAGDISLADTSSASNSLFMETFREAGIDPSVFDREILSSLRSVYLDEIKKEHKRLKEEGTEFPEVVITEIWENILKKLGKKKFSDTEIQKTALVYESLSNRTYPMPGAEELISFLSDRQIVTGLVSNAQFYTPLLFNAHFKKGAEAIGFDSDLSVFSYMYRKGKPDPFLFREAAARLDKKYNIKPEQVLYTGNDMLNDIQAAESAGMKTALFAGDRRSLRLRKNNPLCRGVSPDAIITKLYQICDIINNPDLHGREPVKEK